MSRGKTNPFPTFQFALLGLLLPGATYGYELHKQLSNQTGIGLIWQVKLSNVYAVLEQLLEKGWLSATLLPGESRPGRKMFQITEHRQGSFRRMARFACDPSARVSPGFYGKALFPTNSESCGGSGVSQVSTNPLPCLVERIAQAKRQNGFRIRILPVGNRFSKVADQIDGGLARKRARQH